MRQAKVITERSDYPLLKLDDIVYVYGIEKGSVEYQTPSSILIETQEGILIKVIIDIYWGVFDMFQMLDSPEPEPLSKEAQAQAILLESQCKLNAMLIDNKSRENDNFPSYRYSYEDFDNLQEEIQRRINDLNKEK